MNYQARREAVLEKMLQGSVAILYSGVEVHVSADEYEHFHVLSTQKNADLQEYIDLDNFVAKVLDADLSRIEVIDIAKVMNAIS